MRIVYILFICFGIVPFAFSQGTELTVNDKREIRTQARKIIEGHLPDLLNTLSSDDIAESQKQLLVYNSYLESPNQIFFSDKTLLEDDINPDNTVKKSGADVSVRKYLDNLQLYYMQSSAPSIKVTAVSVGEVLQKDYTYVLVNFKIHFTNANRQKTTKYVAVDRVAELRAEKPDKQWIVRIARIAYFNSPAIKTEPAPVVAVSAPVTKSAEPARKPAETPKPAETQKPAETAKATVAANEPKSTEPQKVTPVKETVPAAEKKETPVAEMKKTEQPEVKKEEPAAQKKPEMAAQPKKEDPAITKPVTATDRKTQTLNAEILALEKRASKYQTKANLARIGAGVVIVASVATVGILISGYSKYKSQIDETNSNFTQWYDGAGSGVTYGQNFGPVESYLAKPKSMISYASPGIYAAGAGIVVGGVLWFIGSNNNKEAKKIKSQLEQKRKQLSVSPQWSGQQRYAGIQLRYKF